MTLFKLFINFNFLFDPILQIKFNLLPNFLSKRNDTLNNGTQTILKMIDLNVKNEIRFQYFVSEGSRQWFTTFAPKSIQQE
mgnify:CR=1 FL=1